VFGDSAKCKERELDRQSPGETRNTGNKQFVELIHSALHKDLNLRGGQNPNTTGIPSIPVFQTLTNQMRFVWRKYRFLPQVLPRNCGRVTLWSQSSSSRFWRRQENKVWVYSDGWWLLILGSYTKFQNLAHTRPRGTRRDRGLNSTSKLSSRFMNRVALSVRRFLESGTSFHSTRFIEDVDSNRKCLAAPQTAIPQNEKFPFSEYNWVIYTKTKSSIPASPARNRASGSSDLARAHFSLFESLKLKMIGLGFESPSHSLTGFSRFLRSFWDRFSTRSSKTCWEEYRIASTTKNLIGCPDEN
jgi:hypothetical protein